jgi:hypothetical protein
VFTAGRLTPASEATSSALYPSSRHNAIRARLATTASAERLLTTLDNSFRCAIVKAMHHIQPAMSYANVCKA